MSIAANNEARIVAFDVNEEYLTAHLADGRIIRVPLAWSWRLAEATKEQRGLYEIIGNGEGVHWPEIDEDISVHGMLQGTPARRSASQRSA